MIKKRNRRIALFLAVMTALFFTQDLGTVPVSFAADTGLTASRGVYWYSPHEYDYDLTDTFVYDEAQFKSDSLEYNRKLATMTFELAVASISSTRELKTPEGYANKSRNLKAYLEDNGFVDFDTNADYKMKMSYDTMGAACAHKEIVDNGKTYTLLAIVPRSAGYESEWGGNFTTNDDASDTGDSAGFRRGKEKVLAFAREYVEKYGIRGDLKVWTGGYSRGAGVANQVGAALINRPKEVLGNSVGLEPQNLYCYTFGMPNSTSTTGGTEGSYDDPRFHYIHNTLESYDIITAAPPKALGFDRYGTVTGYDLRDSVQKAKMLAFLKWTNPYGYEAYINSGDPDLYHPKTLDLEALMQGRFKIVDDGDSYLPDNYTDFIALIEGSMAAAMGGSRAEYYSSHLQDGLRHFVGYFKSHPSENSDFIGALASNEYTAPMVAFMYISYMVERFHDTTFDEDTIVQIDKAIDLLDGVISELNEAGKEVPDEMTERLDELKDVLKTSNTWGAAKEATRTIAGILYGFVITDALTAVGYDQEAPEIYAQMTSPEECAAMTRGVTYLLLYDSSQTEKVISFEHVSQQIKHFATFIDNAGRFQLPHMNEVILSWLRTLDPAYEDYVKENDARKAGCRRLYIEQPDDVNVTGTIKDSSGNVVAQFKDGELISRTDPWIGITTCDTGNWLRIPTDNTYQVELRVNKDARLNLRVAEYSVFEGREVRTVTRDNEYNWTELAIRASDEVTWKIPEIQETDYEMPSKADYAIEITAQDDSGNPFVDVSKNSYYFTPVLWATEMGITCGIDKTHFGPDLSCTRAQLVTFLWRAAGSPEPGTVTSSFTDVKAGSYYEKAVLWAVKKGITLGTSETSFSPKAAVTRGQSVTFLHRFIGTKTGSEMPFTDVAQGAYYYEAVRWAAETGVAKGVTETTFVPNDLCSRAQIAAFLYRAYNTSQISPASAGGGFLQK